MKVLTFLLITVFAWGCSEVPTTPTTPDLKRGGGGKPTPPSITLNEYWVEAQSDGSSLIHVRGEGSATDVSLGVSHDFFENGWRDGGSSSQHYEFYFLDGVPSVAVTLSGDGFHADVIWPGTKFSGGVTTEWTDQIPADGAEGADPFVFSVYFPQPGTQNNTSSTIRFTPQGVILGGTVVGTTVTTPGHGTSVVNSFAVFAGEAALDTVSVQSLTATNVQCSTRKRRGQVTTTVEADVNLVLNNSAGLPASAWVEFHFKHGTSLTDRMTWDASGIVSARMRGTFTGTVDYNNLSLIVDYVVPTGEATEFAFDPSAGLSSVVLNCQ